MNYRYVTNKQPIYTLVELYITQIKPGELGNGYRIKSKAWSGPINDNPDIIDDDGNYYPLQYGQPEDLLASIFQSTQQYAQRLVEQATAARVGVFVEGVEGGEYYPKMFAFNFHSLTINACDARIEHDVTTPSIVLTSDLISSTDMQWGEIIVAKLAHLTEITIGFKELSQIIDPAQKSILWLKGGQIDDLEIERFREFLVQIFGA